MKNFKLLFLLLLSMVTSQKFWAQAFILPECNITPSNTYAPMNSVTTANSKNRIAFIIPASKLQVIEGGKITSVYFKRITSGTVLPNGSNFKIYLKSTADIDLGANDMDWDTQVMSSTLVYDADPATEVGSTAGYKQFVLTTDFTFDAGKNLQIMCEFEQTTGAAANITWGYESYNPCVDTSNSNTTKYWTGTAPFATTLSGTNYRRPAVAFDFVLADPSTVPPCTTTLLPTNNATNVSVTPNITWNMVGGLNSASSYLLYLGTTPGGTDVLNGVEVSTLNYQIPTGSPLNYSTTYYLKIVPKNVIGEAVGCSDVVFTTQAVPCPTILSPQLDATEQSLTPTITWASQPGVTNYKLTVGTTPGGTDVMNNVDLGNVNAYTFATALNASTTYYYKLLAYAGTNASASCTERKFTTVCPPVTEMFENFDSYSTGNIVPNCWARIVPATASGSMSIASTSPFSGTRNIYMMTGTNSNSVVVALPNFSNVNAGTHRLRLKARVMVASGNLSIGYVTDVNDASSFVVIQTLPIANTSYTAGGDYSVNIPTSVPANAKLAFKTASDGKSYYIDDVIWEKIPTCYPPTAVLVTSTTTTTANVAWGNPATPPTNPGEGYEIYYSTNNIAPTATTTALGTSMTTSYVIPNLNPSSSYFVWVRSKCAANDASSWSNAVAFTTACGPMDTMFENFETLSTGNNVPNCWMRLSPVLTPNGSQTISTLSAFSGTKNMYLKTDVGSHSIVVVLPEYSNMTAGTHWLRMKARVSSGNGSLLVGYLTDPFDSTTFVTLQTLSFNNTSYASGVDQTVEIPTSVPTTARLAIKVADNGVAHYIDDVYWEAKPSCIAPWNIVASNVTLNTADLTWSAPATAPTNGYDIYYSTNSTAPTSATSPLATSTTPNKTLTGLSTGSYYYVWVRSNCGTSTSPWSVVATFGTQCSTASVPYVQDFESAAVPGLPICTTSQNAGTGNNWGTVSNPGNGFTTKTLRYGYNSDNNANAWFYTNGINLVAGVNYKITFDYGNNDDAYIEKLKVAFGTSPNATDMTTQIADFPNIADAVKHTVTYNFTVPANGVYYFGFNAYSDMDQFSLYVDNITIDVAQLSTIEVDAKDSIVIYPNPFVDVLKVSDIKEVKSISINDASGRLVKTIVKPTAELQLGELKSGLYLLNLHFKDGSVKSFKAMKK